jgi:hypothetical protein
MSVEDIIARAVIAHMDNFASIHSAEPASAAWRDYSPLEQAKAKLAAHAVMAELERCGHRIDRRRE